MKWNNKILFLFFVCLLLLSACKASHNNHAGQSSDLTDREDLVLAIGGEASEGFDPTTGWGRYGSPLFQSTLLKYDQDFIIEHDLAVNYEISNDALEYTVEIRDDVTFSDGKQLTVDDVIFTYETAKQSASIIDLSNLESVEEVAPHTVRFTLNNPDSTFMTWLTTIGIVPKHAYNDSYNENPIGSGPYKLVQWNKDQQLIVEENENYYGEKPHFKKITFLFLEEDAAFAAAKAGEVDVVSVPPSFAKETIAGMDLLELETVDNRGIMFPYVPAGEETEDGLPIGNDVTSDLAIRQAVNMAINRSELVESVLEGFGTPAHSVADHLPWWNPDTEVKDNDIQQAKKLLTNAGWKETKQGVREKDGQTAFFTLIYPLGDEIRQSLSLVFAEMMKEIGIEVKTEGKSWNDIGMLMHSNPVMMGWGSHDPLEMYNIYSSKTKGIGFYNANYYSNPTVDEYIEKAMRATSPDEANEYWKKAQWDGETGFSGKGDTPWVWLVNLKHLYFVDENLVISDQKIQPHGHGWPITDDIEKWHWRK